jgi:hypothetical protein
VTMKCKKWCMHGLSLNCKYFFLRPYKNLWTAGKSVVKRPSTIHKNDTIVHTHCNCIIIQKINCGHFLTHHSVHVRACVCVCVCVCNVTCPRFHD